MMKLWAISDLHVRHAANREAIEAAVARPGDWLILAGDLGESEEQLAWTLDVLGKKYARLLWVPGNHELWRSGELEGEAKYQRLVALCRERAVFTPEDPYPLFTGQGGPALLAPLFLLYDYTFRPPWIAEEDAVPWAREHGLLCTDEWLLSPAPHASRQEWCRARIALSEERLAEAVLAYPGVPTVLINHFPLREGLVRLSQIPRFSIWCGTKATEEWHLRFRAQVVVSGHLHLPRTDFVDGVRFEEVSLGYPKQRPAWVTFESVLRQILPDPGDYPFERFWRDR
jgi:predicted phosphodiesterase